MLFDAEMKKVAGRGFAHCNLYTQQIANEYVRKDTHEMWEDRRSNLKNMQIFGSECYAKVTRTFEAIK